MSFEALKQVYRLNNLDTLLSRTIEYLVGKYDGTGRLIRPGYPKRRLPRVINVVTFPRSDPGFDELYGNAKVTLPDNMELRIVPSAFGFYHFPKIIKLILEEIEKPNSMPYGWSSNLSTDSWPLLYRKLEEIYYTNHLGLDNWSEYHGSLEQTLVSEYLTRMNNIGLSYDPCRPNVVAKVDLNIDPVRYDPDGSDRTGVMYGDILGDLHTPPDSNGPTLSDFCVDVGNQSIETTFGDQTYQISRDFGVKNTNYAYNLVDICRSWMENSFFDLYSRYMTVYQRVASERGQEEWGDHEITRWLLWYLQYAYLLADAIRQIGPYTGADYSNANLPAHWHDKMEIRISDNKTVTLGYK